MLFCHVTTRVEGDKYPDLLREKGGTGFPTLLFLDAEGKILAKQGERTVAGFERTLKNLQALDALAAKAAAGDVDAQADLLIAKCELGAFATKADADKAIAAAGKLDEKKARVLQGHLTQLEINELVAASRKPGSNVDLGATFAGWLAQGKVPAGDTMSFYSAILTHAEKQRDAALFKKALEGYMSGRGSDPRFKVVADMNRSRLGRIERFQDLTTKAKAGDAQAEYDLVLLRIEMGDFDAASAKEAIAACKVGDAEKKAAEPWLLSFEVKDILATARTPEQRTEAQGRLAELFAAGKIPKAGANAYFMNLLMYAQAKGDAELQAKLVAAAKEAVVADPSLSSLIGRFDKPGK